MKYLTFRRVLCLAIAALTICGFLAARTLRSQQQTAAIQNLHAAWLAAVKNEERGIRPEISSEQRLRELFALVASADLQEKERSHLMATILQSLGVHGEIVVLTPEDGSLVFVVDRQQIDSVKARVAALRLTDSKRETLEWVEGLVNDLPNRRVVVRSEPNGKTTAFVYLTHY